MERKRALGFSETERQAVSGCVAGGGLIAAPFIALAYSRAVGLAVLIGALTCVIVFGVAGLRGASGPTRTRLLILVGVNFVFLVCAVLLLGWLIAR